jgi:tetratricopeptide (TPR) repeat protein
MKIKFRSKFLAIQAVLIATGWNVGAYASQSNNNLFSQGVGLLNAKRYGESVVCLTKVTQENPKSALAHCYLGLALIHLGRMTEARQEFFASYCLDPDGTTGKYAQSALAAFQPDSGKQINAKPLEQDENYKKTLSVIHEQAQREKSRKVSSAESAASGLAASTEAQVSRIRSTSDQTLGVSPYVGLTENQSRDQPTTQAGSPLAQAEESIRIARMAAKQKSADYRSWSGLQEKRIEDVASNLASQLKQSHVPGQAVLKPQGTGFYVRYYGPTDSQHSLPEVHPGVVRILDPNSSSFRGEELSLDSNKSAAKPDVTVKGRILKP